MSTAAAVPGPPRLIEHVAELRRRLGNRREVHRSIEAHGFALSASGVPEGAEVHLDGMLEAIPNGVVVTGTVTVPWTGECRRCLDETHGDATAEVREIFDLHPVEGETWPLRGDELDLGPMVHDTVLLTLPLAPLCSDDCRGPAPAEFPAVPSGAAEPGDEPAADRPAIDPRWAALDDLDL
ncbi:MAG: hypothetical protein JWN46_2043 [Acidimicrobiales bacterium]|nr:hypothetical protein [Acidimicrobiales bacterium]